MENLSSAHHSRKQVAGVCMIAAPLLFLASSIVAPMVDGTKESSVLAKIGEHVDRQYISTVLLLAGLALLVPAVLGLMHMLRERRVAYGHVGGGLALIGVIVFAMFGGLSLMQWQMVRGGADRAQMVALLHRFDHTTGTQVFLYLSLAFTIGLILLALGLYLARAVHWSTSVVLSIGAVVLQVALIANRYWLFVAAAAVLFVGFATIGWMTLRESDEAWEHVQDFRGFRPIAGT